VIGSYFLAQEMKVKGPRRRRAKEAASGRGGESTPQPEPADQEELVKP
jgi:hypothetical protein